MAYWDTVDPAYAGRNNGQAIIPYGSYFDSPGQDAPTAGDHNQSEMNSVVLANNMLDALHRGDGDGYAQALDAYKQATNGQQPPWSFQITPDQVQMNSTNPGGVNYQSPGTNLGGGGGGVQTPNAFSYGGNSGNPGPVIPDVPDRGFNPRVNATPPNSGGSIPQRSGYQPMMTRGNTDPNVQDTRSQTRPMRPSLGNDYTQSSGPSAGIPRNPYSPVNSDPTRPSVPPRSGGSLTSPGTGAPPSQNPTGPIRTGGPSPNIPDPTMPTNRPGMPSPPTPGGSTYPYGEPNPFTTTQQYPGTAATFPNWNNNGSPYFGSDPGYMAESEGRRAADYGNLFQNEFGNDYTRNSNISDAYAQGSDTAYKDLWNNPGYSADETQGILNGGIPGGPSSLLTTQDQFNSNYLTPGEQTGMMGDPNAPKNAYDPFSAVETARKGVGDTKDFFNQNYQKAMGLVDQSRGTADTALNQYGTDLGGSFNQESSDLRGAVDPTKLGVSDAEVGRLKDQAGRTIGAQFGAADDDLVRRAEAAGNVNPLALSAARNRMYRTRDSSMANAVTDADLAATGKQREANTNIAGLNIGVGTTLGGQAASNAGNLANARLNSNESQAALGSGVTSTYGGMGTNLGMNSTNLVTGTQANAGNTAIGQAQYADTNAANRSAQLALNRQNTNQGNQGTAFNQGRTIGTDTSGRYQTIGDTRLAGKQATRNYLQGQGQYYGTQKNTSGNQQLSGAQTNLSGMGQAGNLALGTENGRRNKTLTLPGFSMNF